MNCLREKSMEKDFNNYSDKSTNDSIEVSPEKEVSENNTRLNPEKMTLCFLNLL